MIDSWTNFMTLLIKYDAGVIIGCFWLYYFYMLFQLWKHDTDNPFFIQNNEEPEQKESS